jgi:GNAT superfamily N-acetyltransferase
MTTASDGLEAASALFEQFDRRLDELMSRMDEFDEAAHPRGQPTNKGQFVSTGGAASGMTLGKSGEGQYVAQINGEYAGHAHVAQGQPFLASMHVHEDHTGKGVGHALHEHIEKQIGRPLVPNPLHLSEDQQEWWKKRLAEMPHDKAKELLTESRKIGSEKYGRKQTDIDKLHMPLRQVVGGMQHPGHGYSPSAYVDSLGRINTNNVEDAARALYEKREVVLNQPRQVSTLIDHLGRISAEMIRLGGKAPVFDLCKVSIAGTNLFCAESKGIPRVKMPQLNREATRKFRHFLQAKGYTITREKEEADKLRATQDELNGAKVAANAKAIESGDKIVRRIIVSKDNYILDGHHRWAALVGIDARDNKLGDTKMKISRVNASITELLKETEAFGAQTGASVEAGTPGGSTETKVETGMKAATPEDFVKARDKSKRQQFLSPHPASELAGHILLTNDEGTVGISVDPKGDIQNVFNNGGPKGGAGKAMVSAIEGGGRTLDCFDGFLPSYYHQFGFAEDSRMKFSKDHAPPGWDFAKHNSPDVVFMSWRGYMGDGGASGALKSAADRKSWSAPERSKVYGDDWDAAKERSRQAAAAVAGSPGSDRGAGAAGGPQADRARGRTGAGASDGAGRTVAADVGGYTAELPAKLIKDIAEGVTFNVPDVRGLTRGRPLQFVTRSDAYNPNEARIPKGQPNAGQWTSGGGGMGFTKDDKLSNDSIAVWHHQAGGTLKVQNATGKWKYGDDPDGTEAEGDDEASLNKWINDNKDELKPAPAQQRDYRPQPKVVEVPGDKWNKATAKRLEEEFVKAAPTLDALAKREIESGNIEPVEKPEDEDEEEQKFIPEEWDSLSADQQEETKNAWMQANKQDYIDSEESSWRDNGEDLHIAKVKAKEDFNDGSEKDWAIEAINQINKDRYNDSEPPLPFTAEQIVDAMTLDYDDDDYEGNADAEIDIDGTKLADPDAPDPDTYIDDPAQIGLPGIEQRKHVPPVPKEFTPELNKELTAALVKAFDYEGEHNRSDVPAPDYLEEQALEYMDQSWDEKSDKDKFSEAKEHLDSSVFEEDEPVEKDEDVDVDSDAVISEPPEKYDPLNEGGKTTDYRRTQAIARKMSIDRGVDLLVERGLIDMGEPHTWTDSARMLANSQTTKDPDEVYKQLRRNADPDAIIATMGEQSSGEQVRLAKELVDSKWGRPDTLEMIAGFPKNLSREEKLEKAQRFAAGIVNAFRPEIDEQSGVYTGAHFAQETIDKYVTEPWAKKYFEVGRANLLDSLAETFVERHRALTAPAYGVNMGERLHQGAHTFDTTEKLAEGIKDYWSSGKDRTPAKTTYGDMLAYADALKYDEHLFDLPEEDHPAFIANMLRAARWTEAGVLSIDPEKIDEKYRKAFNQHRGLWEADVQNAITARKKDLNPTDNELREAVSRRDKQMWEAWKGSSTSPLGKMIQIAAADELGGRVRLPGKPKLEIEPIKPVTMPEVLAGFGKQGTTENADLRYAIQHHLVDMAHLPANLRKLDPTDDIAANLLPAIVQEHMKPHLGEDGQVWVDFDTEVMGPREISAVTKLRPEIVAAIRAGITQRALDINSQRQESAEEAAQLKFGGYKPMSEDEAIEDMQTLESPNMMREAFLTTLDRLGVESGVQYELSKRLARNSFWRPAITKQDGKWMFDPTKLDVLNAAVDPTFPNRTEYRDALNTKENRIDLASAARRGFEKYMEWRDSAAKSKAKENYHEAGRGAWEPKEKLIAQADKDLADVGGYKGLKALLRAKWETTQWLLDKAGIHELNLYRAVVVPTLKDTKVERIPIRDTGISLQKLPEANIIRAGAQSTALKASVSNGWDGPERIVLRMRVPRTAALSVPAYGINVHAEREVVVTGTAWKDWDAWRGQAPDFHTVPIEHHAKATPEGTQAAEAKAEGEDEAEPFTPFTGFASEEAKT